MADWQSTHITQNLPILIRLTDFNILVKVELLAHSILDKADVDKLDALQTQLGKIAGSYHYYEMLMGRTNAYKVLTKALLKSNQTGAARLLINGVPTELYDKPLTYLDISTTVDSFQDAQIEVNGNKLILNEFLPGANYEKLQKIFEDSLSEIEIYDTFITKQRTFVLALNTVPPKPPIYLPRFLSNRIKIDETIFKSDLSDVFVFKNTIPRHKLTEIAKPHFTETSISQLTSITCRFIYLDENEDWNELKNIAKVPIHLINYEAGPNHFHLEDSSEASHILEKLESRCKRLYMNEEDFVQQQISKDCTSSSICICDSPGMGKSFLLASIARRMIEKCDGTVIAFVQLTTFAATQCEYSSSTSLESEISLNNILSYICPTSQNKQLLYNLVKAKLIRLEVFFDGFDEISDNEMEWTKQVFKSVLQLSNVTVYITSRPHLTNELEQTLGVVAYDILPFNQQNQVNFLVEYWQDVKPTLDQLSLQTCATICLEAVNKSLTKNDTAIAGIPLLCHLIADVYSDKLTLRSIKSGRLFDVSIRISGIYQKFIEKRIHLVSSNQTEFNNIKLVHIWHALKLLYPTYHLHEESLFENIYDLLASSVTLKAGILQKQSNASWEFMHRTIAEYFVAEYFLREAKHQETSTMLILQLLLKCQKVRAWDYLFEHPVIVAFFNSALGEGNISEELKIHCAKVISSYWNQEILWILCACCQHNLLNMFSFLRELLSKCDTTWILNHFTNWNFYELFEVCIRNSPSQMFHACVQLLTEVFKVDVIQINTLKKHVNLLQIAAQCTNYEAVEYFVDKVSLNNQDILNYCIEYGGEVKNIQSILNLLLHKDQNLIHEIPDILVTKEIDLRYFKILVKFGLNLAAVNIFGDNCVMRAAKYMSLNDYHKLVRFLLADCKAEYLFLKNEKWKDPLAEIVENYTLLPETLKMLLKIPSIDKERWEKYLLFCAVETKNLNELQQLVKRGRDYKAKDKFNRSLLHMAAWKGGLEMVLYLFSLKLDPNSPDEHEMTPLHYAAFEGKLSVVEVLVEKGANVQAKNVLNQTALHLLVKHNESVEVIKLLIGKGAGVNYQDVDGNSPLHFCQWSKEVKECLIEMGANISTKNEDGETPEQKNPKLWI